MNKIASFIVGILMLILICSGGFAKLFEFFAWLFLLQYSQAEISIAGQIFVRILTFVLSYGVVGVVFNCLNFFESRIMRAAYFVVSTLIGFGFSYVCMIFEAYIKIIAISIAAFLALCIILVVLKVIFCAEGENNK